MKIHPGQNLRLEVTAGAGMETAVTTGFRAILRGMLRSGSLYAWLGLMAAVVVLTTGLERLPASVMPEEVYPSLRAVEMLQGNFGEVFMRGSTPYAVSLSAFLQVLPQFFRPNTMLWIRVFNAVLGLLAALSWAVWLRSALRLKYAWVLLPLLTGIPAWFLLTRSALDISLASSLFTAALALYGLYRCGQKQFIYAAAAALMLAWYAAPAARLAVPTVLLLLILADWRYHQENRRLAIKAVLLAALMALPLIAFLAQHPGAFQEDLAGAGSFLTGDSALAIKAGRFGLNILNGLNPFTWFLLDPNTPALYRAGTNPPLPLWLGPFIVWGGAAAIQRLRQPQFRLIWIGWLAAAVGAAPYDGRLPELLLAVPFLALMGVIGLHRALGWLQTRWKAMPAWLPGATLLAAAGAGSLLLLFNGLTASPRWHVDYGREGLQYGAPQIYAAAEKYALENPQRSILVWPEWSQDPEALRRFFVTKASDRVRLGMVDSFLYRADPAIDQVAFLIPDSQYQSLKASGKFDIITAGEIDTPDGSPAFALVELAYTPQAEEIMAQEAVQRRALVSSLMEINGEAVEVHHSRLDIGSPEFLFDGNRESLIRSAEANPLVVELKFSQARPLGGILMLLGSEPVTITVMVSAEGESSHSFTERGAASDGAKEVQLAFPPGTRADRLRLEVRDETADEPAHVHLWEVLIVAAKE